MKRYTALVKQRVLNEIQSGKSVESVARARGISPNTINSWKKKTATPTTTKQVSGVDPVMVMKLREENTRLKLIIADQFLRSYQ